MMWWLNDKSNRGRLLLLMVAVLWTAQAYPQHQTEQLDEQQEQDRCIHCPSYVARTAFEKQRILMQNIIAGEYSYHELPELEGTCAAGYDWQSLDFNNQFDRFSDERPAEMNRFFHRNAITASVELVPSQAASDNYNFTGIFRGAPHGVLRWSPLAPLLTSPFLVNQFIGTFLFSFGLKFLRDNIHSANILTGDTLKGRRAFGDARCFYDKPDFNIFSRPVDNMPGIDRNGPLFGPNEAQSGVISLADAAAYTVAGLEEATPKTPFVVKFTPNPIFVEQWGRVDELDFRKWAPYEPILDAGTVLYTVTTTVVSATGEPSLCVDVEGVPQVDDDVPQICPNQQVVSLGELKLTSRFYASKWSDEKLFFQHTRACPKDQTVCDTMDGTLETPGGVENNPLATFADTKNLCVSDDDTTGVLTGIPPSCPMGLAAVSDNCYPGVVRGVEATQVQQCPFILSQVAEEILGDSSGEVEPEDCSCFNSLTTKALSAVMGVTAFGIRVVVWPFEKIFE